MRSMLPLLALSGFKSTQDADFGAWDEDPADDNLFGYDFGYDDDLGDDDLGDDDDDDDDDIGDDDLGDDDLGDDELGEDDDIGARRRRSRRNRNKRRGKRGAASRTAASRGRGKKRVWGMTILSDSVVTTALSADVQIRLQHDFMAKDLTMVGSAAGARVTSITFGDRNVFSNPEGVPIELFATGSFIRGLVKNQKIPRGLDIRVSGTVALIGDVFTASFTGLKPVNNSC